MSGTPAAPTPAAQAGGDAVPPALAGGAPPSVAAMGGMGNGAGMTQANGASSALGFEFAPQGQFQTSRGMFPSDDGSMANGAGNMFAAAAMGDPAALQAVQAMQAGGFPGMDPSTMGMMGMQDLLGMMGMMRMLGVLGMPLPTDSPGNEIAALIYSCSSWPE